MKRVIEGHTLAEALASVVKDSDLKEAYFTTPVALKSAFSDAQSNPSNKWPRTTMKGNFGGKSFGGSPKGQKKRKGKIQGTTPGRCPVERLQFGMEDTGRS